MYKIIYLKNYEKKALKFLKKHPELQNQYFKIIKLLEINPNYPSLRLHKIEKGGENLHSISINISYRITLDLIIQDKEIILLNIGNHDEIY